MTCARSARALPSALLYLRDHRKLILIVMDNNINRINSEGSSFHQVRLEHLIFNQQNISDSMSLYGVVFGRVILVVTSNTSVGARNNQMAVRPPSTASFAP